MKLAHMPVSLHTIAQHINADLSGPAEHQISGVATLRNATGWDLSFFTNRAYLKDLEQTKAGVVILAPTDAARCPVPVLVMSNPYLGYALAARLLYPDKPMEAGIHPSASIDPGTQIPDSAVIGAHVVIGHGVTLGERCVVSPGCVIEDYVKLGDDCKLCANVTLCQGVSLGARVIIHPGAVIGADGFGLAHNGRQWMKIPQLGSVKIGNDVEIGSNTTIDRGALEDTIIEDDVRLDNQIQVAHNVFIGAHTAIAGCVGIAGSTRIGRGCLIGGGVGISGHLEIADRVQIAAGTNVLQSLMDVGSVYAANISAQPQKIWQKNHARLKHLDDMARQLKRLQAKLDVDSD